MSSEVIRVGNNTAWTHEEGDQYVITGTFPDGRRFKAITVSNWRYADSINLYRGTKWLLRDGVRYRLTTVNN